jgi:peptidoglycan L-alanyl-D-glutamate endopeptidase CwlK
MPKFSKRSKDRLNSCHPDLVRLFETVIEKVDCTIIEGVRTRETQEEYVRTGKSKTMNSKHLPQRDGKSWAVDCMAWPIDWNDWHRNYLFAGYVKGVADSLGIKIRMGSDWDGDMQVKDQSFHDLPHFELIEPSKPQPKKQEKKNYLPDEPTQEEIEAMLDRLK